MKFFSKAKDGGPESRVTGYWLVELKQLFSVVLLRFDHGSREAYHEHAFDAVSWVLKGELLEDVMVDEEMGFSLLHEAGPLPIVTKKQTFHKVSSNGTTWVLSFRGPWSRTWREYDPLSGRYTTLTHGRKVVG